MFLQICSNRNQWNVTQRFCPNWVGERVVYRSNISWYIVRLRSTVWGFQNVATVVYLFIMSEQDYSQQGNYIINTRYSGQKYLILGLVFSIRFEPSSRWRLCFWVRVRFSVIWFCAFLSISSSLSMFRHVTGLPNQPSLSASGVACLFLCSYWNSLFWFRESYGEHISQFL